MKVHFCYEVLDSRQKRLARFLGQSSQPLTMAGLGSPPNMVPTICTYRAYFSSPDTDPFSSDYEAVLEPYLIDPMNAAAAQTPASISQQIYTSSQQGDPTAFLLWRATPELAEDRYPGQVLLLHFVSHYAIWMGQPSIKWDDRTVANRGDVPYGTTTLVVWDPTYLHLALAVYVPSAAVIDTSLARDSKITLLGPYDTGDAGVEIIRCRKMVYVPAPYVGLLLSADLSPVEAWKRLRGAIVDAAAEAAYRPIIDCRCATIVQSGPNTHSALMVPDPSAPLPDAILLQHRHRILLSHLTGLDPSINRAEGTGIAETVREVAVELRDTRLENKRDREKKDNKGAAEYFGENLTHLLNLVQVNDSKDLPPVWEPLARSLNHQKLLVLQRDFDTAAEDMGLRAPTIATPSL